MGIPFLFSYYYHKFNKKYELLIDIENLFEINFEYLFLGLTPTIV